MSAQELITEHLDLWTGAVTKKSASGRGNNGKIELTGVKRLRELILELAVRGSLVDQDTSDEPAQKLLEQCLKAKAVSVELGKLKKVRKHASITNDDTSFSLPQGWVWSRLDDVVRVINGRAYKKHEMLSSGTPLLRVGNLFTSNDWYYSDLELEDDKYIDSGDLIYAWSASFGPFIWDGGRAIYHYHIWKLDLFDEAAIDKRFLYLYLKAVTEEIKSSGSGIAMIHMTKSKMEELIVPVPPLKEQHRIVQKVDELMALCDRLEQQTNDQLEAHETLVDTLLGTLTQSENATELADNWTRLAAHFDTLLTTEQSIDKLKQTILQLAVMGRLVEQDAGDEPAEKLLADVAEEKSRCGSKKTKSPEAGSDDEELYRIPQRWKWTRFGELVNFKSELVRPEQFKELDQVAPDSIEKGTGKLLFRRTVQESGVKGPNNRFYQGQILYSKIRPSLSKAIIAPFDGLCSADMYPIEPVLIEPQYLLQYMLSEPFLDQVRRAENRVKMPKLNMPTLSNFSVAIPPLAEQKRIIRKIRELNALCNQLKERLKQASETRCQVAEAVVEGALTS